MEQVLVVDRNKLLNGRKLSYGFMQTGLKGLIERIYQHGYFINRPAAESDPDKKQIIPYMLVKHRNRYFLLQRQSTQTEKRLHNKHSLGVGGHINPVDGITTIKGILEKGLERELHEELTITCPYTYTPVGYLNDDTVPVGQVHLGLIYVVTVKDSGCVRVAETDLMIGRFAGKTEIMPHYDKMETWSQILCRSLLKISGK